MKIETSEIKDGIIILACWLIPSFIFSLCSKIESNYFPTKYIKFALDEAIGSHIWNVFGTIGLFLFGMSIIFPTVKFFSKGAHHVFSNTYSMGLLAIGIMFGQAVNAIHPSNLTSPKIISEITILIFLMVSVLSINVIIWYMSKIILGNNSRKGLPYFINKADFKFRIVSGGIIAFLPLFLFLLEK